MLQRAVNAPNAGTAGLHSVVMVRRISISQYGPQERQAKAEKHRLRKGPGTACIFMKAHGGPVHVRHTKNVDRVPECHSASNKPHIARRSPAYIPFLFQVARNQSRTRQL